MYIKNFRAYQDITTPFDEEFNVIVGKNDIGKSTILGALAVFFEHETIKIDNSDLSIILLTCQGNDYRDCGGEFISI